MASFFRNFAKLAANDLANQYAHPVQSLSGAMMTRMHARRTAPLERAAVDRLHMGEDSRVLEIGYGRGEGLAYAWNKIQNGSGMVFGIDSSAYMHAVTAKRFDLEAEESGGRVRLEKALELRNLPYPNELLDGVWHVDCFYFWHHERMLEIVTELYRVLRPGGRLVCAMQLSRLDRLAAWGLLHPSQFDPMRYMEWLEPAGFRDVKMEYVPSPTGEMQLMSAEKPQHADGWDDPEKRLAELERVIKRDMVMAELMRGGRAPTAEDARMLREMEQEGEKEQEQGREK